jgi:hypothetical protein
MTRQTVVIVSRAQAFDHDHRHAKAHHGAELERLDGLCSPVELALRKRLGLE